MQTNYGRQSKSGGNRSWWRRKTLIICLSLLFLFVAYWVFVQPFLCLLYIIPIPVYEGIDYYTTGEYLQFEHGSDLKRLVTSFNLSQDGGAIYFAYIDYSLQANPIYGDIGEIFALDYKVNEKDFDRIQSHCDAEQQKGRLYREKTGDFELYIRNQDFEEVEPVIAINKTEKIVRFIIRTNADGGNTNTMGRFLCARAGLSWQWPYTTFFDLNYKHLHTYGD